MPLQQRLPVLRLDAVTLAVEHLHPDVSVWGVGPFRLVIDNRPEVQTAVFNYVNSLPVNGTLQTSDLMTVLTRFKQAGVIVQNPGSLISPAGDLVPAVGSTLRTTLGLVSITSLAPSS